MGFEIERKFLVTGKGFLPGSKKILIRQGFLNDNMERMVRIRIIDDKAFLTVKGQLRGAERSEFEYAIPLSDAESMLDELCIKPVIEKYRYITIHEGHIWEVDIFKGDNKGLIIAELELSSAEQEVSLPEWIGEEITGDKKYYNASLARHPFRKWG